MINDGSTDRVHGGNLHYASREFDIPLHEWMDLSTGIAPWSWPVPDIPGSVWKRLPAEEYSLELAAANYYGCESSAVLALPGSQFAIQALPHYFKRSTVALPTRGYFEHEKAWREAGHHCHYYRDDALDLLEIKINDGEVDVVVVINPNNPTTVVIDRRQLLKWAVVLQGRGGCLIVDEAFMDVDETMSMAGYCPLPGLIVLRSLGKFFGLAGLRLGFLLSEPEVKSWLKNRLGPWSINGPAHYIGTLALKDTGWQQQQRMRVRKAIAVQFDLIKKLFESLNTPQKVEIIMGPLFISVFLSSVMAEQIFTKMAVQGTWLRRFDYPLSQEGYLRFGLVENHEEGLVLCRRFEKLHEKDGSV